jgi:hypothetical protein
MRYGLAVGLVLTFALCVAGCSDPFEDAAQKAGKTFRELQSLAEEVKSESDARDAIKRLEALAKELDAQAAEVKKQSKMSSDQQKKVKRIMEEHRAATSTPPRTGSRAQLDVKTRIDLSKAVDKVLKAFNNLTGELDRKMDPKGP